MGVGNDPVDVKSRCFGAFPCPPLRGARENAVGSAAEHLDAHRKSAIARDDRVTMTGMYNVIAKLRTGEALTPNERTVHGLAACGVGLPFVTLRRLVNIALRMEARSARSVHSPS